jgi:hypothetical protein
MPGWYAQERPVLQAGRAGLRRHAAIMRLALLAILCAAAAHAATVTGFDGRVTTTERLPPLADVDSVVLGGGPLPLAAGTFGLLLVDGSWLPAEAVAAGARPDHLLVRGPFGPLEIPLEAIAAWGDPPPAPGTGDSVQVASGLLAGRVNGLRDGILSFLSALDTEPLALPLAEIRGARLGNPPRRPDGLRLRATIDPARPGLDLVVAGDGLALAAAPAVRLDGSALGALVLRVEGGRRVYLSDLTAAQVREEGLFGVVWPSTRDRALGGGPLRLGGVLRAKGLAVHSAATLGWKLDGGYVRLRAESGICDSVAPEGDCVAVLRGDGRELWRARVRGGEPVRRLDLDLTGVALLELVVETGERYDIGDHLVLADAQLIRK